MRGVKIENITFNKQNLFLENKDKRKSTVCICRPHAVYADTSLRKQLEFQRHKKSKFSVLKTKVRMNLTFSGSHSKPLFFYYIKP